MEINIMIEKFGKTTKNKSDGVFGCQTKMILYCEEFKEKVLNENEYGIYNETKYTTLPMRTSIYITDSLQNNNGKQRYLERLHENCPLCKTFKKQSSKNIMNVRNVLQFQNNEDFISSSKRQKIRRIQ